jgi:hypothetical protein
LTLEIEMRCFVIVALVLYGNAFAKMAQNASADMAVARASSEPSAPTYPISLVAVQAHYQALQNLTTVAANLKVEKISSHSQDVAHTQIASIRNAITAKIKEHPKWDVALSATEVQALTLHLALLKTTFGEKSYSWAWFLKQTGKTAEAKQILTTLFNERSASLLKLEGTYNQESPLLPVLEVEQPLIQLSSDAEKVGIQKKMQELKVHVSNLRDYMIQT